jgi:hypothetical protein
MELKKMLNEENNLVLLREQDSEAVRREAEWIPGNLQYLNSWLIKGRLW